MMIVDAVFSLVMESIASKQAQIVINVQMNVFLFRVFVLDVEIERSE
jgi:hypothetical protein